MTACPACTCADALQNPAKASAGAHRHCLSDMAEPMLIAPQSRVLCGVIRNSIERRFSCQRETRIGDNRADALPPPHNCARIQWCLDTIVIGAGSAIAQPRNASNKGQATAPLLL